MGWLFRNLLNYNYWITQHRLGRLSPTTSPVFPVNLFIDKGEVDNPESDSGMELTGVVILFKSVLLFLIWARCFFKSAKVPLIVTNTVTFILPLASVLYDVSFWPSRASVRSSRESLSFPSGAFRFSGLARVVS